MYVLFYIFCWKNSTLFSYLNSKLIIQFFLFGKRGGKLQSNIIYLQDITGLKYIVFIGDAEINFTNDVGAIIAKSGDCGPFLIF